MIRYVVIHTAPTEIYTLSLHDALPILSSKEERERDTVRDLLLNLGTRFRLDEIVSVPRAERLPDVRFRTAQFEDRKSTRLNSSHVESSYAVFCLKKKTIKFFAAFQYTI